MQTTSDFLDGIYTFRRQNVSMERYLIDTHKVSQDKADAFLFLEYVTRNILNLSFTDIAFESKSKVSVFWRSHINIGKNSFLNPITAIDYLNEAPRDDSFKHRCPYLRSLLYVILSKLTFVLSPHPFVFGHAADYKKLMQTHDNLEPVNVSNFISVHLIKHCMRSLGELYAVNAHSNSPLSVLMCAELKALSLMWEADWLSADGRYFNELMRIPVKHPVILDWVRELQRGSAHV